MTPLSNKNKRIIFYAAWIILSLLQAAYTQIQDDEAYYWVYSRFLSWGYFDHPPMIAFLIRVGTALLPGGLGVRLFPLLLNVLTIRITEELTNRRNLTLFYAICLSIAALQVAGFWAVPDTPLLFFTALFFLTYRNFFTAPSWPNTLLLALTSALLIYSKYHGILVIFFTFLSNYKNLLRQPRIYVCGGLILLLLVPHLWWQYRHHWITFEFQLLENKAHPYQVSFTLNYILGQIAIAGPLSGLILLWSTFAYSPKDAFERSLKYTAVGFFIFFFFSSFKGDVEPNWTAPVFIPLCVLTYNYIITRPKWRTWLLGLLYPTVALTLAFRIVMVFDILSVPAIVERFHSWQGWPNRLKMKTQGLPVVFTNSYQRASMFWYNTGQTTFSLNSYKERQNNYDFWPIEDSLLGRRVMLMDIYDLKRFPDSLQARLWTVGFKLDSNYHSFTKVILALNQYHYRIRVAQTLSLTATARFPELYKEYLNRMPSVDERVKIGVFDQYKWIKDIDCEFTLRSMLERPSRTVSLQPMLPPGKYYFEFAIGNGVGTFTQNSSRILVDIDN